MCVVEDQTAIVAVALYHSASRNPVPFKAVENHFTLSSKFSEHGAFCNYKLLERSKVYMIQLFIAIDLWKSRNVPKTSEKFNTKSQKARKSQGKFVP